MNAPKTDPVAKADTALCLSLRQPWLEFILSGLKTIETRTWTTSHRGRLILHASNTLDRDAMPIILEGEKVPDYARGAILGECVLEDVRPMTLADEMMARVRLSPGRMAWVVRDVVRYIQPIPYRGALSLFPVPTKILPPHQSCVGALR